MAGIPLENLLNDIRECRLCAADLPLGPRPVVRMSKTARILIIGQAPGTKVHASGVPWDDASGKRLRQWMGVSAETFYDESAVAIVPMGFCYPGRGRGGDLPPRPECAEQWHQQLLSHLNDLSLVLLVGRYAQNYYLPETRQLTLTERVRRRHEFGPLYLPLVHPSPRNTRWLQKHPWFEQEVVPELRQRVQTLL